MFLNRDVYAVFVDMEESGIVDDAEVEMDAFQESGESADDWFFDNFPDTWSTLG